MLPPFFDVSGTKVRIKILRVVMSNIGAIKYTDMRSLSPKFDIIMKDASKVHDMSLNMLDINEIQFVVDMSCTFEAISGLP
jgi:hypothetical protein